VDPTGTPVRLDRLRTVEREWSVPATAQWDESPAAEGEQALKRRNVLTAPVYTYRDWYSQPVRFASFIAPGRYTVAKPRDSTLQYLAELTGAKLRKIRSPAGEDRLVELELAFRHATTGEATRLVLGGLDLRTLPTLTPAEYDQGWQVPLGIANPSFFESYEELLAHSPLRRSFYGFHLDAKDRWLDHHAIGVDGPLLHRDATDPTLIHLYLLGYERHALLNHFVIPCPVEACT
jgi:hypothetical protein